MTLPANPTTALRLTGRDVIDLLHRISTQSLEDLPVGSARATLFCDFRARLLHRAFVVRLADESVWLLRDDAPGADLAAYVDKHVFREDVKIEDLGTRYEVRGRLGGELAPGQVVVSDGAPLRVGVGAGAEFELVAAGSAPRSESETLAWERARIEAGRPRHGHEISDAFHPYEAGLWDDVHLSKGCYTGQEVLQRLITYDSVRRGLTRVGGPGEAPATPAPVCVGEERVGTLTSAVAGPDGGWIGLAVLTGAVDEATPGAAVEDGPPFTTLRRFPPRQPEGRPSTTGPRSG